MLLRECLDLGTLLQGSPETEVSRVVYDSRRSGPGTLFVAVPGFRTDGHSFVADAIARGASAVMVEHPVDVPPGVAVLQVPSSRRALGTVAARLYRHPARRIRTIGVTGTNGKTTTTHLIRHILMEHGYKVGLIGTVHNFVAGDELPALLTTPQASDVQELLDQMVQAGCEYAVMEVSSEGLDLNRVDDVEFDIGVFTNLTQDHLNYHRTLENYREAKLRLFRLLSGEGVKPRKTAVINQDDPSCDHFRGACTVPVTLYGLGPQAHIGAEGVEVYPAGSRFALRTAERSYPVELRLAGRFNVYNALAAASVCLAEGVPPETITSALARATGVAGRMEPVFAGQPFGVFVDYAHSPDGLENVLRTVQSFTRGRVISVFGCGGDRDRTKRPQMGRISAEIADFTIVTSDNPRSEEPEAILAEIEAGIREVRGRGQFYELVVDREQAIRRAVEIAGPEDVILIAGKGHETYQIFRDRTIEFDDRAVARRMIEDRLARKGGAV